jgi:hypothetical protein
LEKHRSNCRYGNDAQTDQQDSESFPPKTRISRCDNAADYRQQADGYSHYKNDS